MGRLKGDHLVGLVGNVVLYTVDDKRYIKTNNLNVRQTKATKASAKTFGRIKSISAELRSGLREHLPSYLSKPVMFAMDAAVRAWYQETYHLINGTVKNIHHFSSLHLNKEASPHVQSWLGGIPEAEWHSQSFRLHIPSIERSRVLLPKYADAISFTLVVTSANLALPAYSTHWKSGILEVNLKTPTLGPVDLQADLQLNDNCLYVAFLFLRYKSGGNWLEEEKWKPVLVVGSC